MYKVFTDADVEIVLDWLDSMKDDPPRPTMPPTMPVAE